MLSYKEILKSDLGPVIIIKMENQSTTFQFQACNLRETSKNLSCHIQVCFASRWRMPLQPVYPLWNSKKSDKTLTYSLPLSTQLVGWCTGGGSYLY